MKIQILVTCAVFGFWTFVAAAPAYAVCKHVTVGATGANKNTDIDAVECTS